MSQQRFVTMQNGSEWEFDPLDFQYHCLHVNFEVEVIEQWSSATGSDRSYEAQAVICRDCGEDISENYDLDRLFGRGDESDLNDPER